MPLRYAILHHTGIPSPHFDLMFETAPGSDLATWRVAAWPIAGPASATRLKDHRRVYLDFQGELTQGRGRVDRIADGTCTVEIGEGAHWRIQILAGSPPMTLLLTQQAGDAWIINP
jgi:hypothetical protein